MFTKIFENKFLRKDFYLKNLFIFPLQVFITLMKKWFLEIPILRKEEVKERSWEKQVINSKNQERWSKKGVVLTRDEARIEKLIDFVKK